MNEQIIFHEVQIGRGLVPLAQHGYVVVTPGQVTLLGSDRRELAAGPITGSAPAYVRFTRRQTVSLTLAGQKYHLSPGWGATVGSPLPGGQRTREAADLLLDCLLNDGVVPQHT